jgi:Ca2+-binding EF-hand superfamily protein
MIDRLFSAYDGDGDGTITPQEIESVRAERFERLDANGDGVISREEANELRSAAQTQRRRSPRADRGEGRDPFAALDRDSDGVVTRAEFSPPEMRLLDRADMDGDGEITRAEVQALANQFRGRRRG